MKSLFYLSLFCLVVVGTLAVPTANRDDIITDLEATADETRQLVYDGPVVTSSEDNSDFESDGMIQSDDTSKDKTQDSFTTKLTTNPITSTGGDDDTNKDIDKVGGDKTSSVLTNSLKGFITVKSSVLESHIQSVIKNTFKNEPITRMILFHTQSSRTLTISHINGNTFAVGKKITSLKISNEMSAKTNTYLAYRPNYTTSLHGGTPIAGIFINMEKVFPCLKRITSVGPICKMYTAEEDGFNNALTIIEAGDNGNNIKIFSGSNQATYGFGFKTCRVLNEYCLPSHYQSTIVCQLPRAYCG